MEYSPNLFKSDLDFTEFITSLNHLRNFYRKLEKNILQQRINSFLNQILGNYFNHPCIALKVKYIYRICTHPLKKAKYPSFHPG